MPNNVSVHYPEIWTKKLQNRYDNNGVMTKLVNTSLSGELAQHGDTVHMSKAGDISINNYSAGTNTTIQTLTSTEDTLILDQAKYYHFSVDDLEKAQANIDIANTYLDRAAIAMNLVVDASLLSMYSSVDAGNIFGSDASPIVLTQDNIFQWFLSMGQKLDELNIPSTGRVVVVPPYVATLITRFIGNRDTADGDTAIAKAMVMREFAGFEVYKTTNLQAVNNVFNLMFFKKEDFIHHVMRIPASYTKMYDIDLQFGKGFKGMNFYGNKVFHTTAGVVMKVAIPSLA